MALKQNISPVQYMNNLEIEVSSVKSVIYGPILGTFLAIRESGLATDADNFFSLASSQPCWMESIQEKCHSERERNRSRILQVGSSRPGMEVKPQH